VLAQFNIIALRFRCKDCSSFFRSASSFTSSASISIGTVLVFETCTYIPKKFDILLNSHSLWHWSCVPFDVMVFMFEWEAIQDLATKQFVCS
jgi:hypothetical protein